MPNFAFIDQIEQKINLLLSAKKYSEAFNVCKEQMFKFPGEERLIELKKKIEHLASAENDKIIAEKLNSLKPFWQQEKYAEILRSLRDMLILQPDNSRLKKLYLEAETKYKKQIEKLQEEFEQKQTRRLSDLLTKQPEQLAAELYILATENPNNEKVRKIVADFRDQLIQKKIKEKSELLSSEKFDDIENFLQLLRKIDESNPKIAELEKEINLRKFEVQVDQSKEYVYMGEKHLDTLMKLKKYDKVIKVASEILHEDKSNSTAAKFLERATTKYENQLRKLATEAIIKNLPTLKLEYNKDKDKFIKI